MDWLERRNNTDCPCCRTALVSDNDVWETVQRARRERRKQNRRSGRRCGVFGLLLCCGLCISPEESEQNDERLEQEQQGEDGADGDIEMAVPAVSTPAEEEVYIDASVTHEEASQEEQERPPGESLTLEGESSADVANETDQPMT